jgi:membrane protein
LKLMRLRQKQDGPRAGLIRPPLDDDPTPKPELHEPPVDDPGLRDLTFADWKAIMIRAFKQFLEDNCTLLASALAYSTFFAIPSVLIVTVGLFTLLASPETITSLMSHFRTFMPPEATTLLGDSLRRADQNSGSSLVMTILGVILALWAVTSAMTSYMTALNMTYERKDRRSFLQKRIVALKMAGVMGFAFALVTVFTILGPIVERAIASRIGPAGHVLDIVWWLAQWPILLVGLLVAFATLLYLGPDVEQPRWEFLTPGSLVAALLWIASSALFAVYTATFASYNKTWGTLSAVIVTLTWLWLTATALLLGAEINREAERSRQLRARSS